MELIDLGAEVTYSVKVADKVYDLREPSAKEVNKFREEIEKEDKALEAFTSLVVTIGMPQEVAEGLPISKLRKLADALTEGITEKK